MKTSNLFLANKEKPACPSVETVTPTENKPKKIP